MKLKILSKLALGLLALGGLLCAIAPAQAQFVQTDGIFGLTANLVSQSGTDYTYSLTLDAGAYFVVGGTDYAITGVDAFYNVVYPGTELQTGGTTTGWSPNDQDHHAGGYATNFGSGLAMLTPSSGSVTLGTFTFDAPISSSNVGFHVASSYFPGSGAPGGVGTGYIQLPEPAYFQLAGLLAMGGLGTAFRRLRKPRNA